MVRRGLTVRVRQRASTKTLPDRPIVLPVLVRPACPGTRRVHIPGTGGLRGQARRRVSPCDTPRGRVEAAFSRESPCIRGYTVALLGKSPDPLPAGRGSACASTWGGGATRAACGSGGR